MTFQNKFKLDDEVRYVRESGQMGMGYIEAVKTYSDRVANLDELTIGFPGACIPQITFDDRTGRYYESNHAQIFIFPLTELEKFRNLPVEERSRINTEYLLNKRKQTRMYKILDFIRRNDAKGLTYGEIQKFIYEDIYKGRRYDPKLNRGTYGSNLQYVILPIYCERTSDGRRWRLKSKVWIERVLNVQKPLCKK